MKVNPWVIWNKRYQKIDDLLHQLPFVLVGGPRRAAQWLADKLVVTKFRLVYPHLPKAFDGLTITHLTDLHLGPLFSLGQHLPNLIHACQTLDSDLICCTGDWVDFDLEVLPLALKEFEKLRPRLGWFGVLGNHDYHQNRWQFLKILRPWLKERLLINQSYRLQESGESIDICGLDFSVGGPRLARGLGAIRQSRPDPAPFTLGLVHYPESYDAFREALGIDLALSGHTHGGQICWDPPPAPPRGPVTHHYKYCRGLYEVDGSRIYVGCGLGATIPIRINCPPEVTQFTLVRS